MIPGFIGLPAIRRDGTVYGSIAYGSWSTSGYNSIALAAAAITKAGITALGGRLSWDTDGSFGGTWANAAEVYVASYYADQTGTTNDPRLTVVHRSATRRIMVIA